MKAFMRIREIQPHQLLLAVALLAGVREAVAQQARFFRIIGPTATTISSFEADGRLVWRNAQPGATYTVQSLESLSAGTNWVDYVQLPAASGSNTNLLRLCNDQPLAFSRIFAILV